MNQHKTDENKATGGKAPYPKPPTKKQYKRELLALQVELVKLQKRIIHKDERILVIIEGRDAGGKDGTIKRLTQHLSPRETRVVALPKPSDRERGSWYFQRYVPHLPAAQEMVLFNRSWYNRAGVEPVMGFCGEPEYQEFMETVPAFEQMLVRSGIKLFKYYLDIGRAEQKKRLEDRRTNPLTQWKTSAVDDVAQKHWRQYSALRNEMLARTHSPIAEWIVVRGNNKRMARLNLIHDLLSRLDYADKDHLLVRPDPEIVFTYNDAAIKNGMIEP